MFLVAEEPVATAAATEVDWFVAGPGIFRTDVQAYAVEYDPVNDLMLVAGVDPDGFRLMAIRPSDLDVVAERTVVDVPDAVLDFAVSRDGETLFVLTSGLVRTFETDTLEPISATTIVGDTRNTRIIVAPDQPERFAIGSIFAGDNTIDLYDHGEPIDTTGLILSGNLIFGETGDSFYTAGSRSDIDRYEIGGEVERSLRVRQDSGDSSAGMADMYWYDDQLVLVNGQHDTEVLLRDPDDLLLLDRAEITSYATDVGDTTLDTHSGRLYVWIDGRVSGTELNDLSGPGVLFTLPFPYVSDMAALPDGELAVLELDPELGGWLTIISTDVMASDFGEYHALSPARILDTREPIGVPRRSPIGHDDSIRVQVAGVGGVPADGVLGVVLNATVTNPTDPSFIAITPSGLERRGVSNVNFLPGQTLANATTVVLGEGGGLDVYNVAGSVDVVIDVMGYYGDIDGPPGARFHAGESERLADTRDTYGQTPKRLGPGEILEVQVVDPWRSPKPIAAVLNVTAVYGTEPSFLTVFPGDEQRSNTSSVNFVAGAVRANLVVSKVSDTGTVKVYNLAGEVDVVVDLFGLYHRYDSVIDQAGRFFPVVPYRWFDSRESSPFPGPGNLLPRSALILGSGDGYTDIVNITAASTTADGFLSVIGWEDGQQLGEVPTSNVNFLAGEVVANAAYATGRPNIAIVNPSGDTHVVVDVFGSLTPYELRPAGEEWAR